MVYIFKDHLQPIYMRKLSAKALSQGSLVFGNRHAKYSGWLHFFIGFQNAQGLGDDLGGSRPGLPHSRRVYLVVEIPDTAERRH